MLDYTRILHLTDLHLHESLDFGHERLLDALCLDLGKQRSDGIQFDFCVFTGDIANTGDEIHFEVALDQLLKIVDSAGLSDKQLLLCPGNHDADRRVIGEGLPLLRDFRIRGATREGLNSLAVSTEFSRYVGRTFECFNALAEQFGRDTLIHRDVFCSVHFLRAVSIVTLNTALLTSAGLTSDLDDEGALGFPEVSLVHALKECPAGVPVVVAGHHPPEFLKDVHGSILTKVLATHSVAYLCGHLHDPRPKAITVPNGNLFVSQSGALYENLEYWNGYARLSADLANRHFKETFRRWWEPRREFSCAEDLANHGVFFSSAEAQDQWGRLAPRVDKSALENWRVSTLLPAILREYNQSLTKRSLEDVFVRPDFERDLVYRKETEERIGSKIEIQSFEHILNDTANYLISSQKDTGKTSTLRQLALGLARQSADEGDTTIPVLINFGSFRHYRTSIENLVRQRLPDLPPGVNAERLLQQGMLTLLIDDVDFRCIERRDAMLTFFAAFPKCRYILASSTAFVESAAFRPEISPDIPFVRVRMRSMRPRQLLSLIEKHGTRDPLKADQLLERVTRDANVLNMPLTAVTSTFLIEIFSEEADETPINQAALVERYIEMLLQKFAPRELLPATFNFKNKVDLLSVVAEHMARQQRYEVSQNEFVGWIIDYLKAFGLKYNASDILRYLTDSKVIECDGSQVRFRLRVFFEFFLATRMREDHEFRDYIFEEEHFLSYPNEISFYAAIALRDKGRIREILSRFREISGRVSQITASGAPISEYLESVEEPSADATEEELLEIRRQVSSDEQASLDRQALLEGEGAELGDPTSQEVVRPLYSTDEERWFGNLVVLSGMLKHMELIPDSEKREALSAALEGWVRFTVNSLGIVGTLAKEKRVVLNGITYVSLLGDDLSVGEVARRLTLMMPIAVGKLASLFLATEKLQLQLEDGLGTTDESPSRQFLRFCLLSDLMVGDVAEMATKVEPMLRKYRYLVHVFARKLYEVAIRYRLPDEQLRKIRSLVGDVQTTLQGVGHKEANAHKVRVIRGLERQRLVATLRKLDE